jgi:thymidylate synthase (FAD)
VTLEIRTTSTITVTAIQSMGGDHMVVAAAKVSTSPSEALVWAEPSNADAGAGLINYLVKMKHGTPFEHSAMTFFVHAPICVWREWHRHRIGFSYNEESARYKQLDPVFYIPEPTRPMIPVEGFKSARPGFSPPSDEQYNRLVNIMTNSYMASYRAYQLLLGDDPKKPDYDRGLARDVLPVGIYSSCWVTCNPRSLMAFLALRTHEETAKHVSFPLWEIEIAARAAEQILAEGWPITYRAFVDNGRVAP